MPSTPDEMSNVTLWVPDGHSDYLYVGALESANPSVDEEFRTVDTQVLGRVASSGTDSRRPTLRDDGTRVGIHYRTATAMRYLEIPGSGFFNSWHVDRKGWGACHIKFDSVSSGVRAVIIDSRAGTNAKNGITVEKYLDDRMLISVSKETGGGGARVAQVYSLAKVLDELWHELKWRMDNVNIYISLDGVENSAAMSASAGSGNASHNLRIGRRADSNAWSLEGQLSNLVMLSEDISPSDEEFWDGFNPSLGAGDASTVHRPEKDTAIVSGAIFENTNLGTVTNRYCGSFKTASVWDYYRHLLRFDLSGIPGNAIILSATLRLLVAGDVLLSGAKVFYIRKLTGAGQTGWTEGGATHLKYDGTNAWTLAGSDYTETDQDSITKGPLTLDANNLEYFTFATLIDAVQDFVTNASGQADWLYMGPEEQAWEYADSAFREWVVPSARPRLTVTYGLPANDILSWVADDDPLEYVGSDSPLDYVADDGPLEYIAP